MKRIVATIPPIIGVLVLIGWILDNEILKRLDTRLVAMNPVTAICLILSGVAIILRQNLNNRPNLRLPGLICCAIVMMVALMKLSEVVGIWPFGIDTLLFSTHLAIGSGPPNRMAPNTAFNFLLISSALTLLYTKRAIVLSQILAAITVLISLLAIVGYAYGVRKFYGVALFIPMALHTATSFLLLAGATLSISTDVGLMAIITNDGPAGRTSRILLPCAIILPIGMGWLRLIGQQAGLYEYEVGISIFVMSNVLVFTILIWWNASQLFNSDQKRLQAEDQLRHSATHDRLTGLANRSLFTDRLMQCLNRTRRSPNLPFTVFFLDLDGFKQVNDRLGHEAGDHLLREVAQCLVKCSRNTDLVARMGGDEFTILSEVMAQTGDAHILAERILRNIPRSHTVNGITIPVGISIGIAVYEAHYIDPQEMIRNADTALYQAKQQGKGCYVVYNSAEPKASETALPANA